MYIVLFLASVESLCMLPPQIPLEREKEYCGISQSSCSKVIYRAAVLGILGFNLAAIVLTIRLNMQNTC